MKSNMTQTKPATHKMDIVEAEIDRDRAHTERLMDLAAKRYYADVRAGAAKATQDCDLDAPDPDPDAIDAIEAELNRYQSDTTWQTALADAVAWGDETARDSKLDAIEAELRRTHIREGWLVDRMQEMQYSEGAQDCDRAVRRMTAIDAVIDGVRARQAQLTADAIKARAAEDCYGPDANDIDALDAACLA